MSYQTPPRQPMPWGTSISGRALKLDNPSSFTYEYMIGECQMCRRFFLQSPGGHEFLHSVPIIFTDGACLNNNRPPDARRAGYGVAIGKNPQDQYSFSFHKNDLRTNQRAELAGVQAGLELGMQVVMGLPVSECQNQVDKFLIMTDSEYAVNGITQYMPDWQRRGFRLLNGQPPANEQAFRRLDDTMTAIENEGVSVGLFHVPRQYNAHADRLAAIGANNDEGVTSFVWAHFSFCEISV